MQEVFSADDATDNYQYGILFGNKKRIVLRAPEVKFFACSISDGSRGFGMVKGTLRELIEEYLSIEGEETHIYKFNSKSELVGWFLDGEKYCVII